MNNKLREKEAKLEYYDDILQKTYQGKSKYGKILFFLLQNALFGFEGLKMADLQEISSLGYAVIKETLELNKNIIKTKQIGKRIFYTADLAELDRLSDGIK